MTAVFIVLALLIVLFLFLTFPSFRKHSDLKFLEGKLIAHRGLHSKEKGIPENSITAFKKAVEKGYMIENDIHITADDEVVVFHDDTLERMCGVEGKIEEKTLAQLKELRLGNTEEKIPTLKECLEAVNGKTALLIEFKCNKKTSKRLFDAANKILEEYNGKYFVQSFHPLVIRLYKKHNKKVCRGQLSTAFKGEEIYKRLLGALLYNFISRPDFVSYEHKFADNFFLKLNKIFGAFPVCWTLKSKEELETAKNNFKTYIFEDFEA